MVRFHLGQRMVSKDVIDFTVCELCQALTNSPNSATHINWYGWSDSPSQSFLRGIPLCDDHLPTIFKDEEDTWYDYDHPIVKVECGSELNIALECAFAVLAGTMRP